MFSAVLAFTFAASFSSAPPDVMLIGTAMAFNAVVEVAYAFFDMLAANIGKRVLVATVTGVLAVVIAHMAGCTARIVIAIQCEELVVIERRRNPFFLRVALAAIAGNLFVQRIDRRFVTALALITRRRLQQGMIEAALHAEAFHTRMIAVTSHAVLADQLLVERC
jgi:hypothetical protein